MNETDYYPFASCKTNFLLWNHDILGWYFVQLSALCEGVFNFYFASDCEKWVLYLMYIAFSMCILRNSNTLRHFHKRNLQWLFFLYFKLTEKLFIWEYITSIEFFLLNGKIMDNGLRQIAPIISCIILPKWRQDIAKGAIT